MSYLVLLSRIVIRGILKILFIFPIKKDVVLIDSMFGKGVSDNAKYYLQYADNFDDNLKYVWAVRDIRKYKKASNSKVRFIKYQSVLWFYYHAVAGIVLYSHYLYNYLPLRKYQKSIIMWHAGGAYKRIGSSSSSNSRGKVLLHKYRNRYINDSSVVFLSSSDLFTKYNIEEVYEIDSSSFKGTILKSGLPRNDLFFNSDTVANLSKKVKKALRIQNRKVVLFAPTFRNYNRSHDIATGQENIENNFKEIIEAFKERFGDDTVLLYRCHYFECSSLTNDDGSIIDVSKYPDMQELLCAADSLITDYSSCMWDYALLKRPCFLYVPDYKKYENEERGFFTPIDSWPGIICKSMQELCECISNTSDEQCIKKAEEHLRQFGSYENGNACKKLYEIINK